MIEQIEATLTDAAIELTETELKALHLQKRIEQIEKSIRRGKTLQRLVFLLENPDACYDAKEGLFLRAMLSFKDIVDNNITRSEAEAAWNKYMDNPNKDDDAVLRGGIMIQSSKIEGMRVILGKPFVNWEESFDTALAETQLLSLEESLALVEAEFLLENEIDG